LEASSINSTSESSWGQEKRKKTTSRFSTVPPCYEEDLVGSFIAIKGVFVCQMISLNIE
jgi:hypothetical protein